MVSILRFLEMVVPVVNVLLSFLQLKTSTGNYNLPLSYRNEIYFLSWNCVKYAV
jgi:hypothetical protein